MTKAQIWALIFREIGKHLLRRWYIYATLLIILVAPFPVILAVGLGWLGFVWYCVFKQWRKERREQ